MLGDGDGINMRIVGSSQNFVYPVLNKYLLCIRCGNGNGLPGLVCKLRIANNYKRKLLKGFIHSIPSHSWLRSCELEASFWANHI
jgi:hypothetical protein